MGHQSAGILNVEAAAADGGLAGEAQPLQEQGGIMLHRLQHLSVGVAAHHMINAVATRFSQA
ncbi:MAG: hypothetical protein RL310_344, partial [Actinomycetota bacterium]